MDCDHDALSFVVEEHGAPPAFCHKKSLTCWGEAGGLRHLQATLQARKASAPPGSYTAKLFADPDFLRNKLLEEAQELAEATEPDHVAAEAADLIYFAMVRVVAAGADLSMIESHLDLRALKVTRRPGLAKKERIDAAAKALGEMGKGEKAPRSRALLLLPMLAAAAVGAAVHMKRI